MLKKTQKSIADSLETTTELLPHMPYLLQDMWAMGCSLNAILKAAVFCDLSAKSSVLDLGCGKGAVSVKLAMEFGCKVHGIDASDAFLKVAMDKAEAFNLSQLCEFSNADILKYTKDDHTNDLVILASLGGIFGSMTHTVLNLRSQVNSGAYMMIDDGFLRSKTRTKRKGYTHYRNYKNTVEELTSCGDQIIHEINTTQVSTQINADYLTVIKNRGNELKIKYPELTKEINAYISLQIEECDIIEKEIEGMLWLIKKQ